MSFDGIGANARGVTRLQRFWNAHRTLHAVHVAHVIDRRDKPRFANVLHPFGAASAVGIFVDGDGAQRTGGQCGRRGNAQADGADRDG